jgi:hypothetical protein
MSDLESIHLLLPGESLPQWAASAVERTVAESDAAVTHLVVSERESDPSLSDSVRRTVEPCEWGLIGVLHSIFDSQPAGTPVSIDEIPAPDGATRTHCEPIPRESFGNDLPEHAVRELREADVAVRVRLGFGPARRRAVRAGTRRVQLPPRRPDRVSGATWGSGSSYEASRLPA